MAVEKQLLKALGREPRGKLTAAGTSLESSLSVEEAERMLQRLAAKGYLEVTVEHSRLYYALGSLGARGSPIRGLALSRTRAL